MNKEPKEEKVCSECKHEQCKICSMGHNQDCNFCFGNPLKACYDSLLPPQDNKEQVTEEQIRKAVEVLKYCIDKEELLNKIKEV